MINNTVITGKNYSMTLDPSYYTTTVDTLKFTTVTPPQVVMTKDSPNKNDIEIVENFEITIGSTKLVLKNATKELVEIATKIMLKEKNAEEKPTQYIEED